MRKLIVVYGGQYGSEGKGDVCEYITRNEMDGYADKYGVYAIRVGGANAGHSFRDVWNKERVVQMLPVAPFVNPRIRPVLGAGAIIHPDILANEIEELLSIGGRIPIIDRNAVVTSFKDIEDEGILTSAIGSTGKGVGKTTANKVMRNAMPFHEWVKTPQAPDIVKRNFIVVKNNVGAYLNKLEDTVHMVECTQGYHLSLNAGRHYPFCTSRDCGPDAQLASCGLTTRSYDETDIVCVLRTFPIRVGGNSGPLPLETSWEELIDEYGEHITPEKTTVTKKYRRVARWYGEDVRETIRATRPDRVFLQFVDYIHPDVAETGVTKPVENTISWHAKDTLGVPITHIGVGKHHIIPAKSDCDAYAEKAIARIESSSYPSVDDVVEKVTKIINEDLLPILRSRGEQYGEDVLVEMGEEGIVTMMLVKLMRARWGIANGKPIGDREDTYIDLAGYALLNLAINS